MTIDSPRREEFKNAEKTFLGWLCLPQSDIKVSLLAHPLFVTFLRLFFISLTARYVLPVLTSSIYKWAALTR